MEFHFVDSVHTQSNILPIRWDEHLARLLSDILCPPVTALISLLVVVYSIHEPLAWAWVMLVMVLMIGVPVSYISWKVRSAEITDFHIPVRTQRIRPMLVTILCTLLTWAVLWLGNAPQLLVSLAGYGIIQLAMMLLITFWWKISGHTAAVTGLAILAPRLLGPAFLPLLLFVPLIAWARVRIRRHTWLQTIAGAVLGGIYISLVLG